MTNKSLLSRTIILATSLALGGCYTHLNQPSGPGPAVEEYAIGTTIENIEYTDADWPEPLQADLYLPGKRGPHPVVLVIHGGGWANRSRDDMAGISRKLTRHGYAVLNVNYRLAPRYTYPAQLHDLNQALGWIAENAAVYDLDSRRINTWGYSAGAHLAALVGSVDHPDKKAGLPRIRSVVAGGIPSDLRKYSGSPIVMRFMGGDRHEMPQRYAEASPAYHVSGDDPPVFLYHGRLDFLVTPDQATDYYAALQAAGVETELYLHDWREHATMFVFGGAAEKRAIHFLNRNNALDPVLAAE
jgi:acetyl esterase/lipase